jgi:hypothetical protein
LRKKPLPLSPSTRRAFVSVFRTSRFDTSAEHRSVVLTMGDDVDLQVRTDRQSFETVRDVLSGLYEPHYVDVWHPEGAYFFAPDSQPRVEIALSAIGSLDDLHHGEAWQRLAAERDLVERYNALKREHEGGSIDSYLAAKRDFFRDNFQL